MKFSKSNFFFSKKDPIHCPLLTQTYILQSDIMYCCTVDVIKITGFFYHADLLCVTMFQYMFDIKRNEEEIVIQVLQDSSVGLLETVGLQRHLIGFIVIKVRYGCADVYSSYISQQCARNCCLCHTIF